MSNVVQEPPENITQEKILFNVVLILLGQQCAGKNLVQFCPIGSRCSVQSCPFVQCWPGIFLVQCQEKLCSVSAPFAAPGYCQNINRFKIKIAEKWCYSDIAPGFFLCSVVWSLLDNIPQDFFLVQCCPKCITTILNRILPCAMLSGASWTTLHNVFTCAMLS